MEETNIAIEEGLLSWQAAALYRTSTFCEILPVHLVDKFAILWNLKVNCPSYRSLTVGPCSEPAHFSSHL
jgi:hypothetical protein